MAFIPVSSRTRARGSKTGARVWAVGSRAFVHCPGTHRAVVLTDEFDRLASATLDDGAEIEVRAWLPRSTGGARYHVRAVDGASEGWLGAEQLRATREMPPPQPVEPAPSPVAAASGDPRGRRFGQR
jgi:hypothetical protein